MDLNVRFVIDHFVQIMLQLSQFRVDVLGIELLKGKAVTAFLAGGENYDDKDAEEGAEQVRPRVKGLIVPAEKRPYCLLLRLKI